ncbi:BTB/POZ domain-containing protein At3g50780-like [Dioscorea cayenensis subsp. rotundata]|uniref:BTB/POZ domain-containing protein At3g50780-like n=1 Tax=Dioscorea cayennensis subsp. rotundata TaxID=55577 RepID=A0AB40BTH5_DIOCR|nr:BTB/POZ domain-containing protein At3g50780-like [Dioscorea cayenensis subsp. rotundata]XP_039130750.1 BTB/POZ domain-containing protein At3g50780-like [Dioscorea cayenensis subsp. rotundata]
MADLRVRRVESGHTKIRNVPIAVTPEGFWCCPAPVVIQKTLKNHNQNKPKPQPSLPPSKTSLQKTSTNVTNKKSHATQLRSRITSDDPRSLASDNMLISSERKPKTNGDNQHVRKISVAFGQPETSDLKMILSGKEGVAVRMSVHRDILVEHSKFLAEKLSRQSPVPSIEIGDCDDVEIYVEIIGLMYCKDVKQRLIKQNVARVLRILKAAELLGFGTCIKSCLEYLEAAPWAGEEEETVVSSVQHLQGTKYGISPILKRVTSDISKPPNDTLTSIMELVLKSNEDRGRREMKSLVLKLLRENSLVIDGSVDICIETLYASCGSCLNSLLFLFKQASEPGFSDKSFDNRDPIMRQLTLEVDNLLWLMEILADRRVADEFAAMWASQDELAELHPKVPTGYRHLVSRITARLFVGIGRGEMLPSKEIRKLLLNVWFQPLINDYNWLQNSCRSFDRQVVEEGIGRTILTLPLEDQQTVLLSWLGSFLKVGDNCPNLQRAFEVWWRRTFIRPHVEQQQQQANLLLLDKI